MTSTDVHISKATYHSFSPNDTSTTQIIWTNFNDNTVSWQNSDVILPQFARKCCKNDVVVLTFYVEQRSRQGFINDSLQFNTIVPVVLLVLL